VPLDRSNPLSNVSTMNNFDDELATAISKGGTVCNYVVVY
jgi:hypothetical protein